MQCTGATYKTNYEIDEFNEKWLKKNPKYDVSDENCQKYALDLAQFVTPGSFKMGMPLAQTNAWADSKNAHVVDHEGMF